MPKYKEEELSYIDRRRKNITNIYHILLLTTFLCLLVLNLFYFEYLYLKSSFDKIFSFFIKNLISFYIIMFCLKRLFLNKTDQYYEKTLQNEIIQKFLISKPNLYFDQHNSVEIDSNILPLNDFFQKVNKIEGSCLFYGEVNGINFEFSNNKLSKTFPRHKFNETVFEGLIIKIKLDNPFSNDMLIQYKKSKVSFFGTFNFFSIKFTKRYRFEISNHSLECLSNNELDVHKIKKSNLNNILQYLFDRYEDKLKILFYNQNLYLWIETGQKQFGLKQGCDIRESIDVLYTEIDKYIDLIKSLKLDNIIWKKLN